MNIRDLVSELTLTEKAGLLSGGDFWHTKAVERLGIPAIMMSDGPHGLRKQDDKGDHLGVNDSIRAVCFPAACATAASFDRSAAKRIGEALGDACRHEKVGVILGPAVNIKRSPLCGRNFEYYSEDPFLAGRMAASFIDGVQSRGVGTSIKHFAANSQEHRRMSSSSNVDERTLREIYLPAFEYAVRETQPWTVMCSYNRLNGVFASENRKLLTEILRNEWGFLGLVVSDWGAVSDRVAGVAAGMDLEMPSSDGINDRKIVRAVESGALSMEDVDRACERVLNLVYRAVRTEDSGAAWDMEAQHALAAETAADCMVLLKNEKSVLPLSKSAKVAFIGEFAEKPRYQGGGSSHINSFKVTGALEAARESGLDVIFAKGYSAADDEAKEEEIAEAVAAAESADIAVVFAGLPDSYESEGYDRTHMRLPECQNRLIRAVVRANPATVVVLHNGSPVEMPWIDEVPAVLEAYLGGQAVGEAEVRVLYGDVNPSGHLAETFPKKVSDNPSWLFYGGEPSGTDYREGVFVGYRYYDKKEMDVLFPFGHGLSYTEFRFDGLSLSESRVGEGDTLEAAVTVTNTGSRAGKAVVQLYVENASSEIIRPLRELKGFEKILLQPGESREVTFSLDRRAFAYWDTETGGWSVPGGTYRILAGGSSRDLPAAASVGVEPSAARPVKYDINSIFMDIMKDPRAMEILGPVLRRHEEDNTISGREESEAAQSAVSEDMAEAMMRYMPLRGIFSFGGGVPEEEIERLLLLLNSRDEN